MTYCETLKSKLLLIHGMADENVFLDHSQQLMRQLQNKMLPFDLMLYPDGKHGIYGSSSRSHLFEMMIQYFKTHL